MYFCRWTVVRQSADGRPTPKISPDSRSIVGRLTADIRPMQIPMRLDMKQNPLRLDLNDFL